MSNADRLTETNDMVATRRLCYAIHRNDLLRRLVVGQLIEHNVQAVCPAFGIDLVAVARHAFAADRRHKIQQKWLTVIRAALVVVLLIGFALTGVTFRGSPRDLLIPIADICVAFLLVATMWGVLFWRVRNELFSALTAWRASSFRGQFPPVDQKLEEMLDGLPFGNVIVYADGQGDPFVGSGRRMDSSNIGPIYIRGQKIGDTGERQTPKHFDAIDLHRYLEEFTPRHGFSDLRAGNRLYVRGDHAKDVSGLLPESCSAPRLTVENSVLETYITTHTSYARTYVCMEQVAADSHLVVSMYVRARIEQQLLSVESNIFALPPVSRAFVPSNEFVINGNIGAVRRALKSVSRAVFPALVGQPTQITKKDIFQTKKQSRKEVLRNIKRGYTHDYGAATSLREAVSFGRRQHYDTADIIDSARRLRRRLIDTVEDFLAEHNVDTSEFEAQANVINNTNISYDIGSISGTNTIVGSHGQVNNYSSKEG